MRFKDFKKFISADAISILHLFYICERKKLFSLLLLDVEAKYLCICEYISFLDLLFNVR